VETLSRIRTPHTLLSCDDKWFRPVDVAVAPDGSLFVADWYDPVVGGGGMDDPGQGRIWRIVPKGHDGSYRVTPPADAAARLASPCLAARSKAVLDLRAMEPAAREAVLAPLLKSPDRILRARALWLARPRALRDALELPDPDFRVLAIRALQRAGADLAPLVRPLLRDPSAQVRRELLLAFRDENGRREELADLAAQYDGHDRFYLEAVAIAYRGREQRYLPALLARFPGGWNPRLARLLWVLKQPGALDLAFSACLDEARKPAERLEALDALASFDSPEAGKAATLILARPETAPELRRAALAHLARGLQVSWRELSDWPPLRQAVEPLLEDSELKADAVRVLAAAGTRALTRWRISPGRAAPDCASLAAPLTPEELDAPELRADWKDVRVSLEGQIDLRPQASPSSNSAVSLVTLLRASEAFDTRLLVGSDDAIHLWLNGRLVWDRHEHRELTSREDVIPIRLQAGVNRLLVRCENRLANWCFTMEIEDPAGRVVEVTPMKGLPLGSGGPRLDPKKPPTVAEILALPGSAARGADLFSRTKAECLKCHRVKGSGTEVGPDLSTVGLKLGREGLVLSILRPSDAIQNEFALWTVRTKSGSIVSGILVEETPDRLALRDAEGKRIEIATADVDAKRRSEVSMMPEALIGEFSKQDLADLVEYMTTLK
jgi:putative heme-binding domain-containing protein